MSRRSKNWLVAAALSGVAVFLLLILVGDTLLADARNDAGSSDAARPAARRAVEAPTRPYHTAQKILFSADGQTAFVVDAGSNAVIVIDAETRHVHHDIPLRGRPVDAVLSADEQLLYVSLRHLGKVAAVSLLKRRVVRTFNVGLEPYGIARSRDSKTLFVANGQSNDLSIIDLNSGKVVQVGLSGSDPRDVAVTADGRRVIVSNGLSRSISIVDAKRRRLIEARTIGRASILREVAISPDGKWAVVAHVVSHEEAATLQMERGWIHSNGITIARLDKKGHYVTLLLDRLLDGAANPWGLAFSPKGDELYVSLAGVHEVAIVDFRAAVALVEQTTSANVPLLARDLEIVHKRKIAARFPLVAANGPRSLAPRPGTDELWIANAFSENVSLFDRKTKTLTATVPLGKKQPIDDKRRGEMLFNDAKLCYQRWFSCASCHQEDATMDALNWDLPNDGMGNAKNVKSLHDIHDTPPAMWGGVRKDIDAAVAAGQRFLGFLPNPKNHRALVAFLSDPPHRPNPRRRFNREAVARGKIIFSRSGCRRCHRAPTYADGRSHDLGLASKVDLRQAFDTPSLRGCYRTAPYLHDGRAATLADVFTAKHDPLKRHGKISDLTSFEISDLVAYLRSL